MMLPGRPVQPYTPDEAMMKIGKTLGEYMMEQAVRDAARDRSQGKLVFTCLCLGVVIGVLCVVLLVKEIWF